MGNCIALSKPNREILWDDDLEDHRTLRIVKTDDKVLEYHGESILVRDLLPDFDGYGVGVSQQASQHLPPEHELRIGSAVHYPLLLGATSPTSKDEDPLAEETKVLGGTCKRIKVVIKKQELQELLSKTISFEEVLSGILKREDRSINSPRSWKPQLETICEGKE